MIHRLRQKPKGTRRAIAFWTTSILILIIIIVWFGVVRIRVNNVYAKTSIRNPVTLIKEIFTKRIPST